MNNNEMRKNREELNHSIEQSQRRLQEAQRQVPIYIQVPAKSNAPRVKGRLKNPTPR